MNEKETILKNKPCKYFSVDDSFCSIKDCKKCNPTNCQRYETTDDVKMELMEHQLRTATEHNKLLERLMVDILKEFNLSNYDMLSDQNEISYEIKTKNKIKDEQLSIAREALKLTVNHLQNNFNEIDTREVGRAYYADDNTFEDNLRALEQALAKIEEVE